MPKTKLASQWKTFSKEIADQLCQIKAPKGINELEYECAVKIARYMGARIGEITRTQGSQVHLKEKIPYIEMYTEKQNQEKYRDLPIHPKALPVLIKLVEARGDGWLSPSCGRTEGKLMRKIDVNYGGILAKEHSFEAKNIFKGS